MLHPQSFTFDSYKVNPKNSTIQFTYKVKFETGITIRFKDKLVFDKIDPSLWESVNPQLLESTLQALLIMLGINYWCVFPTKNIKISNFSLTQDQAKFWEELYLNGLGEYFYEMKMDFRDLISFPYDSNLTAPTPARFKPQNRALLLNGAGKDSILSAEILKASNTPFDFFAFAPTPAHKKITKLVGANTITVNRVRDPLMGFYTTLFGISSSYPSVSTFTFIATLLAEVLGYNSIIFSNEKSADFGNLNYLGLHVNHQWCKSSSAEKMINDYIQKYITPDISTQSLLRKYSEIDIVRRFAKYDKYLRHVTSCNSYFWLPLPMQLMHRHAYWCRKCPKCVFLFACFGAFLPKEKVIEMFGGNLYKDKSLIPFFKRILGIEGFKPLDCVGEPEEMILAMHYTQKSGQYAGEPVMQMFEENFPSNYDFESIPDKVFIE